MKILLLAGTASARQLAAKLTHQGIEVISSLAGRTKNARPLPGQVRHGGFGGVEGLVAYCRKEGIELIVNATHPFAASMSAHAHEAAQILDIDCLRLSRPSWKERNDAHQWIWVDDHEQAAQAALTIAANKGGSILLSVGRQHSLDYSEALKDYPVICRVAHRPDGQIPSAWMVIETIGPFTYEDEKRLCEENDIRLVITKDSGGEMTSAKLDVASDHHLDVVMIARPHYRQKHVVESVDEALRWIERFLATRS